MRKIAKVILILLILTIIFITGKALISKSELENNDIEAIVLFNKKNYQTNALESVLQEEGVPYIESSIKVLISTDPEKIADIKPAIILPDNAIEQMHPDVIDWFKNYIKNGGNVFLIYNPGIKNLSNAYLKKARFADLLGLNYSLYDRLRGNAYSTGYFKVNNSHFLKEFTPGKLDDKKRLITGYIYGSLTYPYARSEILSNDGVILAQIEDKKDGSTYPAFYYRKYGKGYIFYCALPLGHLKAYADDFITRTLLRYFLFKIVQIPHLLNVPKAKGGLVINWHIDAYPDWHYIPFMLKKGYVKEELKYSFHITAGPFRDKPGDGKGFDACGKGKKLVKAIMPYGVIGSHGGWAHNWFAENVEKGKFGEKEIYKYIKMNNDCLQSITGYKIIEYSAPNGVHPQPVTTEILEKLGMIAYYYTGDSGSSPNRTFINGKMVSQKVIAFPITPFNAYASLYEMYKAGKSPQEVFKFLKNLADFSVRTKQIRLFYSHPYDLEHYPDAVLDAIKYILKLKLEGKLNVRSMSYFARFILRFLKTKYSFRQEKNKLIVEINNPEDIMLIPIAIPKNKYIIPDRLKLKFYGIVEDENYYYIYPRFSAFHDRLEFGFR